MSNGLLDNSTFGGSWDTTPIENDINTDSNSKLKPYKSKNEDDSQQNNDDYINPFLLNAIPETNQNNNNNNTNNNNTNYDPEVFDLLFNDPTNTNTTNNNSNNNNNTQQTDESNPFYEFDFGPSGAATATTNNDNATNKMMNPPMESNSSSSSSYDEEDDGGNVTNLTNKIYGLQLQDNSDGNNDNDNDNNKNVKIAPPKRRPSRSKNKYNGKQQNNLLSENKEMEKSENARAFEKLHSQFDPSVFNPQLPINPQQVNAIAANRSAKNRKKRHTAPIASHESAQKQLRDEGLLSPNVGTNMRTENKKTEKSKSNTTSSSKDKINKKTGKTVHNVLPELHRGTALLKYGRRGYPHFRQFNLTADNLELRWFSAKKKVSNSSIHVGNINEILTGQHTKEFRRIAWTTLTPASFSIIYDNKKKSLNLVAKSVDEMKMWVEALRRLRDMNRKGEDVSKMEKLDVEVDFRDRNRPQSRHHSGNFLRSHETKEKEVDPILQRKLIDDIASLRKQFIEISRLANNPIVQSTKEYSSIEQILSELEERIEELDHEIRHTRNTKIAENDVWRTRIDLESLREKIKVLNKQHKKEYANNKRRWSVF